jgi:autotransporter-associated beta strand protein
LFNAMGSTATLTAINSTLTGNILSAGSTVDLNLLENSVLIIPEGGTVSATHTLLASGGTLAIPATYTLDSATLTSDGGAIRTLANTTFSHDVTLLAGGITLDSGPFASTFPAAFSGIGGLTKIGTGTLILAGQNAYTGGTNFNGGILAVVGNGHLGTGPLRFNGGTLEELTGGNLLENADIIMGSPFGGTFTGDPDTASVFRGTISGPGPFTKDGSGTLTILGDNSFSGGTTILDGTLVVGNLPGSHNEAEGISTALGTGNVLVDPGTLRTTSFQTGKPVIIQVHGDYTQKADGTLALGIGGTQPGQFDRVVVAGSANLAGTLQVFSLNNFHPSPGNEFGIFRNGGTRTGSFTLDDSLFNNANIPRELRPVAVELVAPNGVDLVYLKPGTPAPPVVEVPDPTTVQLTALFEIPFPGANIQRFNLDDRMTQIQRTIVPPPPAPAGKETVSKAPPAPAYQPGPRWGVWANGWGDFVNIDDAGLAHPNHSPNLGHHWL